MIEVVRAELETTPSRWRARYADELVFTGYVPYADSEGFGLPPLEAMPRQARRHLSSKTASFPEVVGDAVLSVDLLDAEPLAGAIAATLSDASLQARLSVEDWQRTAFS